MPVIKSVGKFKHIARSWASLMWIGTKVSVRHWFGRALVPGWTRDFEVGILFWRGQFNHAFALDDMQQGRAYFDSLQTFSDEKFDVKIKPTVKDEPRGDWYLPANKKLRATVLYFHGGGYGFYGAISKRFAETLAGILGMDLFAVDYPLTPENPHPAQINAAIEAYEYLLANDIAAGDIVILGDSAGGHMALMAMVEMKKRGLGQPALVVGLCPWCDVAGRGESLFGNDNYDVVQGYMVLEFGRWLKGSTGFSDQALSPIYQNYRGLAPIYLQGGGKEILIDMIVDFAQEVDRQGCEIMLDVWEDMPHEFQMQGSDTPQSLQAFNAIFKAIEQRIEKGPDQPRFQPSEQTRICSIAK